MVTFNCYIQYREIATNNQTQRIRRSQTPPASRHQYYNMISYTALCSYPPIRVSCLSKHSIQANFLNSRIRAELGISIRSYFNTDISWINRKKNDDKRCLISREFLLTKCTLFFKMCHVHQLSNILWRLLSLMSDRNPSKILIYLFLSLVVYILTCWFI